MKNNLDYCETMSMVRAIACAPYTAFFFLQATIRMYKNRKLPRGYEFGYAIIKEIAEIGKEYCKNKVDTAPDIPGLRFSKYHEPYVPEWKAYKKEVTEMVYLCLNTWTYMLAPSNRKKRKEIYNQFVGKLAGCMHKCGPLAANHLVVVLGIIGLIPIWFCAECSLDTTSKGFQLLRTEFGLPTGKIAAEQLVDAVVTRMETVTQKHFTSRNAENLVCKAFRATRGTDTKFNDLITIGQHLYEIDHDGVHIHFQNGSIRFFESGMVLKWNWKGEMVETKQLADKMKVELAQKLEHFVLPMELKMANDHWPRSRHEHDELFFARR
jgi:hypothetical protein